MDKEMKREEERAICATVFSRCRCVGGKSSRLVGSSIFVVWGPPIFGKALSGIHKLKSRMKLSSWGNKSTIRLWIGSGAITPFSR